MITCSVAFLISLVFSSVLTPFVRNLATAKGWLDPAASSRKIHTTPIPRLGGIAIVIAFFAPLCGLLITDSSVGSFFLANPKHATGIFVGGIGVALIGIVDDLKGMGAGKKFSAQFLVAALMFSLGFSVEQISTPWGTLPLGAFSVLFTMVWIVGVINAMNLIDGLDGLASGVAFVAVLTNFVLAAFRGQPLMMLFMAALGGAILGFLIYNFNPASIFMGDTGSMFLGFVLATSSIITSQKSGATVAMTVPIIALGLPIMDTLLAMVRRALRGLPLFAADREHIHHKLLALGWTQRRAVLTLYGICVLFALLALTLTVANGVQTALLLVVTGVVVGIFINKLGYLSLVSQEASTVRQRNLEVREQVRAIADMLQQAAVPSQAWQAIQPLGQAMHLSELSVSLLTLSNDGESETCDFSWKLAGGTPDPLRVRLPIEVSGDPLGHIEVAWKDDRRVVDRDDEIALELLRDHLASAVKRMGGAAAAEKLAGNVVALRRRR